MNKDSHNKSHGDSNRLIFRTDGFKNSSL